MDRRVCFSDTWLQEKHFWTKCISVGVKETSTPIVIPPPFLQFFCLTQSPFFRSVGLYPLLFLQSGILSFVLLLLLSLPRRGSLPRSLSLSLSPPPLSPPPPMTAPASMGGTRRFIPFSLSLGGTKDAFSLHDCFSLCLALYPPNTAPEGRTFPTKRPRLFKGG